VTGEEAEVAELRRQFRPGRFGSFPARSVKAGPSVPTPWATKDDRRNVLHAGTARYLAEYMTEHEAVQS
jgi:hypothetical protein